MSVQILQHIMYYTSVHGKKSIASEVKIVYNVLNMIIIMGLVPTERM